MVQIRLQGANGYIWTHTGNRKNVPQVTFLMEKIQFRKETVKYSFPGGTEMQLIYFLCGFVQYV